MNISQNILTFLNQLLRIVCVILVASLIGLFFMVISYSLPIDSIEKNVSKSFEDVATPELIEGRADFSAANFTDSLMLLTAKYNGTESTLNKALLNYRESAEGYKPNEFLKTFYVEDGKTMKTITISYPRYWHGYLVILKPLLLFLNYVQIEYLIQWWQITLFALMIYFISRKKGFVFFLPFLFFYLYINPVGMTTSIQYNAIFTITILGLYMAFNVPLIRLRKLEVFCLIGCLTSYMDLLTFPLISLGIPLIYIILSDTANSIKDSISYIMNWGIGYCGMWIMKWVYVSIFTQENIILNVLKQIVFRVGVEADWGEDISRLSGLSASLSVHKSIVCISVAIIIIGFFIIRNQKAFSIALVSVLPFIWTIIFANHSYVHILFSFREYGVTVAGAVAIAIMIYQKIGGN